MTPLRNDSSSRVSRKVDKNGDHLGKCRHVVWRPPMLEGPGALSTGDICKVLAQHKSEANWKSGLATWAPHDVGTCGAVNQKKTEDMPVYELTNPTVKTSKWFTK